MRWHSWASFRAEALREWTTWAGGAAVAGGVVAVLLANSAQLGEWATRIGIVSPVIGGALLWLRQQRGRAPGDSCEGRPPP